MKIPIRFVFLSVLGGLDILTPVLCLPETGYSGNTKMQWEFIWFCLTCAEGEYN